MTTFHHQGAEPGAGDLVARHGTGHGALVMTAADITWLLTGATFRVSMASALTGMTTAALSPSAGLRAPYVRGCQVRFIGAEQTDDVLGVT